MIVYADEGAAEGEYLAEGDEDGVVNLASSKCAICMTDALRHWAKATSPLKVETSFAFIFYNGIYNRYRLMTQKR